MNVRRKKPRTLNFAFLHPVNTADRPAPYVTCDKVQQQSESDLAANSRLDLLPAYSGVSAQCSVSYICISGARSRRSRSCPCRACAAVVPVQPEKNLSIPVELVSYKVTELAGRVVRSSVRDKWTVLICDMFFAVKKNCSCARAAAVLLRVSLSVV